MADAFTLSDHLVMAFGTPIVAYPWPNSADLNSALATVVLDRESKGPGLSRSNAGGWHSSPDLLRWQHPSIEALTQRIMQASQQLTVQMTMNHDVPKQLRLRAEAWANICRHGNYHKIHNHPHCLWSGVYYVQAGELGADADADSGKLELFDPRGVAGKSALPDSVLDGRYLIDPLPGLMVLFPSWVQHFVHPLNGSGERISIAFNVMRDLPASAN